MRMLAIGAVLAAALFASAPAAHADQLNEDHSTWKLSKILYDNKDKRGVEGGAVLLHPGSADANGGLIAITISGKGSCAGHAQKFRFTWQFDRDISRFSGKHDDIAFNVTATLEGDKDNCLAGNPFWRVGEYGELIHPQRGGWGTHYFRDPPSGLPGAMTFWIGNVRRTMEGLDISLESNWAGNSTFAALSYHVYYLFEPADGVAGASTGGQTVIGQTGGSGTVQPNTGGAGPATATGANGGRGQIAFCASYASQAVRQNLDNINRRCGQTGDRWHSAYEAHYRWCMGVAAATASAEQSARDSALATCPAASRTLGGVDLQRQCRDVNGPESSVRLTDNTVNGWKCAAGASLQGISVEDACRRQYGEPAAMARYRDFNDPNSWECIRP